MRMIPSSLMQLPGAADKPGGAIRLEHLLVAGSLQFRSLCVSHLVLVPVCAPDDQGRARDPLGSKKTSPGF